jgi:glycerol-3-phosphate dehydrogenase
MVRTVADYLARRRRLLILDARQSLKLAEPVAQLLMQELGKSTSWKQNQIKTYTELAENYICRKPRINN